MGSLIGVVIFCDYALMGRAFDSLEDGVPIGCDPLE
jgi:hypothetical protein